MPADAAAGEGPDPGAGAASAPEGALATGLMVALVMIALALLAAHFLHAGWLLPVLAVLVLIVIAPVRRRGVARTIQVVLALGSLEWLRTLLVLVAERGREGRPATRLAVILGAVIVVTLAAALLFQTRRLRARYRLNQPSR
ncbi:MAG TPA: hypothetical protein VNI57_09165 [Candidatus Saccharimonadales bacterium]|nr:hypothetical protein [Candidatus Saccharimonadales bacterium]